MHNKKNENFGFSSQLCNFLINGTWKINHRNISDFCKVVIEITISGFVVFRKHNKLVLHS